jgi:hypothetical protein
LIDASADVPVDGRQFFRRLEFDDDTALHEQVDPQTVLEAHAIVLEAHDLASLNAQPASFE